MAKSNASEMLTSLDSLFTTQEQRDEAKRDSVQDIPISQISDFPEHPFKVKQDEAMLEMAESVRQYGVLVPGLVRQLEDGSYQMVSGHRRKLASELAGRDTIDPAGFYILKHSLEVGTFIIHSRAAMVRVCVNKHNVRLVGKKTIADFLLVAD